MAANAQELKYVSAKLSLWLKDFSRQAPFSAPHSRSPLSFPLRFLSPSFSPRASMSPIRAACTLASAHAHRSLSLSFPPTQVPNTWLRRIRTRDRELRLAQKVTGKTAARRSARRAHAWSRFRQMVKVSLHAVNTPRSWTSLSLLIYLAASPFGYGGRFSSRHLEAYFSSADLTSDSWIPDVFLFSPRRSLSGCPRARKGGLKLTPNKDDKDEQELK